MTSTNPNPEHARLQAGARDHLLLHFGQHAKLQQGGELLVLDGAEGVYVRDTAGRRYLDALSCLFCAQLGYSYGPEFAEAATAQLNTLPFNTNWNTAHPAAIELAGRLAELAPGDLNRAFFTSGGSESVESAWKLARQYHVANGEPGRTKAIARQTAYHGLTLGALSFTGIPALKARSASPRSTWRGCPTPAARAARIPTTRPSPSSCSPTPRPRSCAPDRRRSGC